MAHQFQSSVQSFKRGAVSQREGCEHKLRYRQPWQPLPVAEQVLARNEGLCISSELRVSARSCVAVNVARELVKDDDKTDTRRGRASPVVQVACKTYALCSESGAKW
jgi:hypothetical protein